MHCTVIDNLFLNNQTYHVVMYTTYFLLTWLSIYNSQEPARLHTCVIIYC